MPRVHLDAVGGIAGDMFVAAMLDALPQLRPRVLADVRAVLPPTVGVADLVEGMSGSVRTLRFRVSLHGPGRAPHDDDPRTMTYPAVMARIAGAGLAEGTAGHAGAILRLLGEAEAKIHGVPLDSVHFHEIADWDSMVDVVAAGSIAAALAGSVWTVGDLPRGGGLVHTQHGLLPVPAPATAAILTGYTWRDDGVGGERVTPTGAAILRHLAAGPGSGEARVLSSVGTGAGVRELAGMPNILRALVFEDGKAAAQSLHDRVAVVSFDIDDMTGEELAEAADRIRGHPGVIDVSMSGALGKKGRPLTCLRLLVREDALPAVRLQCLRQTSTLGVRWRIEEREVLAREAREPAGGPRVKVATRPDGKLTAKAESDDLRAADDLADRRMRQHKAEHGETP